MVCRHRDACVDVQMRRLRLAHRPTDRQTYRHTDRHVDIQTCRHTDTKTYSMQMHVART